MDESKKEKLAKNQKRRAVANKKTEANAVSKRDKRKTVRSKAITIGKAEYINPNTGVLEEFNVISEKDTDYNFQKLWLGMLIESLDIIGNKKIQVLNYLLANKNSDNMIIGTQRGIAEKCSVSLPVVNTTLQALVECKALKKVSTGVHQMNPDLLFKGGNAKRMNILLQYEKVEQIEQEKEPGKTK
jgi:hypothetical protein